MLESARPWKFAERAHYQHGKAVDRCGQVVNRGEGVGVSVVQVFQSKYTNRLSQPEEDAEQPLAHHDDRIDATLDGRCIGPAGQDSANRIAERPQRF